MPNSIPDDRIVVQNARRAVAAELRKKKILEQPIAKYEAKTGKVFMEDSDGTKVEDGETRRGRHRERRR